MQLIYRGGVTLLKDPSPSTAVLRFVLFLLWKCIPVISSIMLIISATLEVVMAELNVVR